MSNLGDSMDNYGSNNRRQINHDDQAQLRQDCSTMEEDDLDMHKNSSQQARCIKRNQIDDESPSKDSTNTTKRHTTAKTDSLYGKGLNQLNPTNKLSSYFNNNNQIVNKEVRESPMHKQIGDSNSRNQHQSDSFPPFRIRIKDVTIIRDLNKKCKLNLTYGRMSSSKNDRCYLLYCSTSVQFELLLDRTK
ncbi:hypothetical protein I4U23_027280 [Adineta vaga]|nr:hypothetical protein I4U23_027280 [Adineta vaga]